MANNNNNPHSSSTPISLNMSSIPEDSSRRSIRSSEPSTSSNGQPPSSMNNNTLMSLNMLGPNASRATNYNGNNLEMVRGIAGTPQVFGASYPPRSRLTASRQPSVRFAYEAERQKENSRRSKVDGGVSPSSTTSRYFDFAMVRQLDSGQPWVF